MIQRKWFWFMLIGMIILFAACNDNDSNNNENSSSNDNNSASQNNSSNDGSGEDEVPYNPPSTDDLDPDNPMTEYIQYGEEIFNETNTVMVDHVGNELSCQSCHADGGVGQGSPMVGVTTQFPQYRAREGVVFTLEDRINGCMIRSMNGKKMDEDSKEMRALMSYLTHISEGIEVGEDIPWRMRNTMKEIPEPSVASGEELYEQSCMSCHGADGAGSGANTGPALWGENSFNDGAGMSRMVKMAGFIKNNMPPGNPNLTDQEAADIAAYILSHERPEWEGHETDWPKGGRPTDIIDKERREKIRNGSFDWTEIDNIIPAD
ncbi:c-type cytochrome [Ornithinibacillus halophilus]|uniref:Thiosulfate dehydrogenase n=1 Tax=Ornithinibacillus halophilus TaxID=930117 RepID=A0A1M5MYZ8_9BACI|nr:c-type cytochrome [Ornithinibacillus halophilus]SHG82501.1 thiosulfate dehydrogenase [Ornithinibacillus halophilus]